MKILNIIPATEQLFFHELLISKLSERIRSLITSDDRISIIGTMKWNIFLAILQETDLL
jgi:hypothetical protein